jgi:hypothetical protein
MQGTCPAGSKAGSTKAETPRGNADDALLSPEDYSNVEAFIGAFEVWSDCIKLFAATPWRLRSTCPPTDCLSQKAVACRSIWPQFGYFGCDLRVCLSLQDDIEAASESSMQPPGIDAIVAAVEEGSNGFPPVSGSAPPTTCLF